MYARELSFVLRRYVSNEETKYKKKRDALTRNDVHWAGQFCILVIFSDCGRIRNPPSRGGRFHETKSTKGISLSRFQT
jgi:hypothetical protein